MLRRRKILLALTVIIVPASLASTIGYAMHLRSDALRDRLAADLSQLIDLNLEVGSITPLSLSSRRFNNISVRLPPQGTQIAEFASVEKAEKSEKRWMEKFGEWKSVVHVHGWNPAGKAVWEISVMEPGEHCVHLTYAGEGRLVWKVSVQGGEQIQNQQNSSHNYQEFPIGWINFPRPGQYRVAVSCLEGAKETASLKAIRLVPVR